MRALVTVIIALIGAVVLMLWLTHRAPTEPVVPTPGVAPTSSETRLDTDKDALTTPGRDVENARVAKPSAAPATTDNGPHCRVFGRVLDERSAALADVKVSLYPVGGRWSDTANLAKTGAPGREHEGLVTQTSSDGRFTFDAVVPTADWVSLDIEPDLYHALGLRNFGPAGGRNKPRLIAGDNDLGDIVLAVCGAVSGRVVSEEGTPLRSAWVTSFEVNAQNGTSRDQTDEQGRFVLGHVPAGARKMDAQLESYVTREDMPIEVRASVTTPIADIVLARAFVISGIVVDEEGHPLPRISVHGAQGDGMRSSARSKDDGTFTLYVEKKTPCTLDIADAKGYRPWGGGPDARFDVGTTSVRIVLQRSPGFTFKVIDARTREPIERFGIRLDSKPVMGRFSGTSERDIPLEDHPGGEARLPLSGEWVVVSAAGHATLETEVTADAGTKDSQTLALHSASSVRGRLMLAGKPLANGSIMMTRESIDKDRKFDAEPGVVSNRITYDVGAYAGRKRTLAADAQGVFLVDGLTAGTWMLQIDAPGAARKRIRGLAVPEEQVLDLGDVALDPGATIRGVLVAAAGETPQGFVVRLDGSAIKHPGASHRIEIDNIDGKFEFTGLVAGQHDITWSRATQHVWGSEDPREQSIDLAAGETREIVLDASASLPCKVIVHLTRAGKPAPEIRVETRIRSRANRTFYRTEPIGTTGSDGTMKGEVDGDTTFDLVATTAEGNELGDIAADLVAVPGGMIERTYELSLGHLILELPASFAIPKEGRVVVTLNAPGHEELSLTALTAGTMGGYRNAVTWESARIDFGEIPSGAYQANVAVHRPEADPSVPKHPKWVDAREPYKTSVTIEAEHEAKIVVP